MLPAEVKNKPSPDTISQKEALLFLPHPCSFYRTRHFSHFWGFDDSSPNVRLHSSSHDPHPTVMQTWSCSLSYTNNCSGIWRPSGSTWGSLTNTCPMGLLSSFLSHRQKHECNAVFHFAHQVSQAEKAALKCPHAWDRIWEGLWCSFAPADSYLAHQTALLAAQRSSTHLAANSVAHCSSFALKTHAISSRKGMGSSILVRGLSWE